MSDTMLTPFHSIAMPANQPQKDVLKVYMHSRQGPRLSFWCWDECGNPLRAGAEKVTASKYTYLRGHQFSWKFLSALLYMCKTKCDFRFFSNFTQTPSKTLMKFTNNFRLLVSLKLEVFLAHLVVGFVIFTFLHLFPWRSHQICRERAARFRNDISYVFSAY